MLATSALIRQSLQLFRVPSYELFLRGHQAIALAAGYALEAHHLALDAVTSVRVHFDWHFPGQLCLALPCRPAPEFQLLELLLPSPDFGIRWQRHDDPQSSKVA